VVCVFFYCKAEYFKIPDIGLLSDVSLESDKINSSTIKAPSEMGFARGL